ncbi:hypothetical protein [Nostoc sp. 'Peltigera malacea cyanobiont' DB3992]|uniref:hypothetical protein n=1 Tax=Nostoc sp. 'Peltigera malacea cyanobiont' DB3992 TaxID=1206980 RepID=UPI0015D48D52|nr:hypothetical protein [Nostoc sp. 'Peltigera malacea cyanobiont' DB3992]
MRLYAKAGRIDVARQLMTKFLNPISSNDVLGDKNFSNMWIATRKLFYKSRPKL